jgi:hypothetical protein
MGILLAFPAEARVRRGEARHAMMAEADAHDAMGRVVILPVIRIERHDDAPTTDRGPEEGAPRRRRRRARS